MTQQPPTAQPLKNSPSSPDITAMLNGLQLFAQRVKESNGIDVEDGQTLFDVELPNIIALLHRDVSSAYETLAAGTDPREVWYVNPDTGELATVDDGVPNGFAVDIVEVILDCMALLQGLGFDLGHLLTNVTTAKVRQVRLARQELEMTESDETKE